jgi:hypothetical protein
MLAERNPSNPGSPDRPAGTQAPSVWVAWMWFSPLNCAIDNGSPSTSAMATKVGGKIVDNSPLWLTAVAEVSASRHAATICNRAASRSIVITKLLQPRLRQTRVHSLELSCDFFLFALDATISSLVTSCDHMVVRIDLHQEFSQQ